MYKLPPWTHGVLSDDENCPHKAWRKHVTKDLPREEKNAAQQFGIDVHAVFEKRLRERKPLREDLASFEPHMLAIEAAPGEKLVEERVAITAQYAPTTFFADDVWGRSVVDVAIVNGPVAVIFDWKTGNPKYEDDFELRLHSLMLKCRFRGLAHVRGHYVWLRERRLGKAFDLSDFGYIANNVKLRMADIEARPIDQPWAKKPNPLCGWCPVTDCEHNRSGK